MSTDKSKEQLENEKLINEIELQKIEIEKTNRFKGWRKKVIRFFEPVEEWGQTISTLFLGIVGIIFTISNTKNLKENSNVMMATQLMSNREKSETDFRQTMFLPLINQVLDTSLLLEKRFTVFQIFQNNFNDLFNSRALFDVLDEAAKKMNDTKDSVLANEIHERLISLARKTNQDQGLLISGNQIIKDSISEGKSFCTIFDNKHDTKESHRVKITVDSVKKEYVMARVILNLGSEDSITLNNGDAFKISYFDSPLTDNILLPDKHRIAVTLENIFQENGMYKAKLKIIHFPAEFITTGYRPSVKFVKDILDNPDTDENQNH